VELLVAIAAGTWDLDQHPWLWAILVRLRSTRLQQTNQSPTPSDVNDIVSRFAAAKGGSVTRANAQID
jgi:hypothetical protein